jgi:DNA-binding transcriptional ArsR family regulator
MDAETLKALADDNRLAIVRLLAGGERCICDAATDLGLSDALVSHHMKRLQAAGLVSTRKQGQWLHCRLEPGAFTALAEEFSVVAALAASAAPRECCTTDDKEQ